MENISKIVVSTEGKRLGYVLDVAIDFQSMQKLGYYVVDEESEGEFLLKTEQILSVSKEYILIDNALSMEFITQRQSVFGKEILDEKCQSLGQVLQIVFKRKKCEKFVTDKCEIPAKYIKTVGENYVFVEFKRKKRNKYFPTFPRLGGDEIVKIQSMSPSVTAPEKIRLSSSFYVGKISTENIMGYNNEKIIQKGEVVTRSVVEKAKRHNKLNQLYFAIKR